MPRVWSSDELQQIIMDYFAMFAKEIKGESLNKTRHRKALMKKLDSRSEGSIEFKHQNISAALDEMGFPRIAGYKPMRNFQTSLLKEIEVFLRTHTDILNLIRSDVDKKATPPTVDDILSILERSPKSRSHKPAEITYKPKFTNYLVREINNASLGFAGEQFAINFEKAKLINAGKSNLADRIEHVSQTQGDGLGYDIRSFKEDGADRFIEVKTTKYGKTTPFYLTDNELRRSKELGVEYSLYRIFDFRNYPKLFILDGDISTQCQIKPTQYVARI